ncbi:GyrI-like domain-containing protein [Paenibacillus chibensis]|nr:GyrI-like domain-containing protein [Paenibacillus chibensis]MEC0372230.1 GyrI-like domain-containing protein [Paenibacillus chibensis]
MDQSSFVAPDRYPGIIQTEVRKGKAMRMIGMETYMDPNRIKPEHAIPNFWQSAMPGISDIHDVRRPFTTIGLYQYKPPFGSQQDYQYVAGVEVEMESAAAVPEGMQEVIIPENDYLVITYRGKASGLGQVWDYFRGYWLPQQAGVEAVEDYEFERHDERYLGTDDDNSVFEMHFPIRERSMEQRLTGAFVVDEKGGHVLQDLRGKRIRMASFRDADFHGIDMRSTVLRHVNFVGATWEHIYFSNLHINEIQMGGTIFEHIRRPDATESQLEGEPGTEGWVNVEPVLFRACDLRTAKFENCDLRQVNLQHCRLEGMMIDGIPVTKMLEHYKQTYRK